MKLSKRKKEMGEEGRGNIHERQGKELKEIKNKNEKESIKMKDEKAKASNAHDRPSKWVSFYFVLFLSFLGGVHFSMSLLNGRIRTNTISVFLQHRAFAKISTNIGRP